MELSWQLGAAGMAMKVCPTGIAPPPLGASEHPCPLDLVLDM
jgi:hypothetical protein